MMRLESSKFISDVFTTQQTATEFETTFFILTPIPSTKKSSSNVSWNALLLHSTDQLFVKINSLQDLCKKTLVHVLDFAEELGVADVFICVPSSSEDREALVESLERFDFEHVQPCAALSPEYEVMRFEF